MDINFCILLLCIFLRNIMAFDKELAILCGFFNLRISKKPTFLEKSPPLNFCLILNQNAYNFTLCFKSTHKISETNTGFRVE